MNVIYRLPFLDFLKEGNSYKGADCQLLIDFTEKELVSFINQHLSRTSISSIYEIRNPNMLNDWYYIILDQPYLKKLNDACIGIKYSESIIWYKRFLESNYNPDVKAAKEAEKERIKQEKKDLRKQEKKKEKEVLSDGNIHDGKNLIRNIIKKQELDDNQREGAITQVNITRRERNPKLREACLKKYGYVCQCCGIDFEKIYGEIGREYIEVHHLFPISQTEGEHEVDPEKDLIPLCSNCHSMIHRLDGEEMTLEKLKSYYHGYDYQKDEVKDY